jgi:hypothetical protein
MMALRWLGETRVDCRTRAAAGAAAVASTRGAMAGRVGSGTPAPTSPPRAATTSKRRRRSDTDPALLQGLSTEDGLKDRDFTHFAIERPKDAGEPLQFDMATDCVALAAGCATKTEAEDAP